MLGILTFTIMIAVEYFAKLRHVAVLYYALKFSSACINERILS